MSFMTIDEFEESAFARDPHEIDDEIAPGVRFARNLVIRFAAIGLAGVGTVCSDKAMGLFEASWKGRG